MNKKAEMNILAVVLMAVVAILMLVAVAEHYDTERAVAVGRVLIAQQAAICIDGCMNTDRMSCNEVSGDFNNNLVCKSYCEDKYAIVG